MFILVVFEHLKGARQREKIVLLHTSIGSPSHFLPADLCVSVWRQISYRLFMSYEIWAVAS